MNGLDKTFALIRSRRDALSQMEDVLSATIGDVEQVLCSLKPGIPIEIDYVIDSRRQWISFQRYNGDWRLVWSRDPRGHWLPLLSATRLTRAEVFVAVDGVSPIEALIYKVPTTLLQTVEARKDSVERAQTLAHALRLTGILP